MMRVIALSLLLALLPATVSAEIIQRRLLRTIQTGTLQQLDLPEIIRYAKGDEAEFVGRILARSALLALGKDEGFHGWPIEKLLDLALNTIQRGSHSYHLPPEMPPGFGGEDLVLTVVYAMVMSGRTEKAIDTLKGHINSGTAFKRGVALQALRNIGTRRANELVQQVADSDGASGLAEILLKDQHFPFLEDLRKHLRLIPNHRRSRGELVEIASEACSRRASMAVYSLGFLASSDDRDQNDIELDLLRDLTRAPCFYNRFFAIRALALRSSESIEFWMELLRGEDDPWQRGQIARIGFAHYHKQFAGPALELLAKESAQYVQWELMHGNIQIRTGARFRDYWDIWQPLSLKFRLEFFEGDGLMDEGNLDTILSWLETGARPSDSWVRNIMFSLLSGRVSARNTRRYLAIFDSLENKADLWLILDNLADPQALPLLRYWQSLNPEGTNQVFLNSLISKLEAPQELARGDSQRTCCQPTKSCLIAWTLFPSKGNYVEITTPEEAKAWLYDSYTPLVEPEIRWIDSLGRVALVTWRDTKKEERWEHLYGCWRPVKASQ